MQLRLIVTKLLKDQRKAKGKESDAFANSQAY